MTDKIRISLSKEEIEYLLEKLPEEQFKEGEYLKTKTLLNNWLRLKLQQAGIKLMFGEKE